MEAWNYFNYFTEIEDVFVRRRGKHLFLSPLDWALMEMWKTQEIPLHIVLRGIEKSFDSYESKPRKRSVKTLLYCQEEVEAQYAEWLESRVGANPENPTEAVEDDISKTSFSIAAVSTHLIEKRQLLIELAQHRSSDDSLSESLLRAAKILKDLEDELKTSSAADTRKLEDSLTGLERMLNDSMMEIASGPALETAKADVKSQLKPYRSQMDKAAYQQTFDNLLLKRLREKFGVPRLSLFYL